MNAENRKLGQFAKAWRTVCAARALATGAARNPERTAGTVANALTSRWWIDYLSRAATAFENGSEPGDDERRATALALDARLWLDEAAGATLSPAIVEAADRVDAAFETCGNALLALEPLEYAEVAFGRVLNSEAWWGTRARLDEEVPEDLLDRALAEVHPQ